MVRHRQVQEEAKLVLAAVKSMVAGALQDRAASIIVLVLACVLLLTAWVLGVAAVVALLEPRLGEAGALGAVCGGLVLLALLVVAVTRARNRTAAESRAMTRALWVATAVNAAGSLLRSGPAPASGPAAQAPSSGGPRSALLIAGGLGMILLAFLLPSGRDDEEETPETGPDTGPAVGPDDAA